MKEVHNFKGFGDDKQHDKDFESMCAYMQKETTRNVKRLTVIEFHSLMLNMYNSRPKLGQVKRQMSNPIKLDDLLDPKVKKGLTE